MIYKIKERIEYLLNAPIQDAFGEGKKYNNGYKAGILFTRQREIDFLNKLIDASYRWDVVSEKTIVIDRSGSVYYIKTSINEAFQFTYDGNSVKYKLIFKSGFTLTVIASTIKSNDWVRVDDRHSVTPVDKLVVDNHTDFLKIKIGDKFRYEKL